MALSAREKNLARIDPLVPLCRPPFVQTGRECPVGVERSTDPPGIVDFIVTALAGQNDTVEPYSKIERPNRTAESRPEVSRGKNKPLAEDYGIKSISLHGAAARERERERAINRTILR